VMAAAHVVEMAPAAEPPSPRLSAAQEYACDEVRRARRVACAPHALAR
jgi:hypothetical protein